MPGMLIIEAMAQTAACVVMHSLGLKSRTGRLVYFMSLERGTVPQAGGAGRSRCASSVQEAAAIAAMSGASPVRRGSATR
jgi:hypothetical protein